MRIFGASEHEWIMTFYIFWEWWSLTLTHIFQRGRYTTNQMRIFGFKSCANRTRQGLNHLGMVHVTSATVAVHTKTLVRPDAHPPIRAWNDMFAEDIFTGLRTAEKHDNNMQVSSAHGRCAQHRLDMGHSPGSCHCSFGHGAVACADGLHEKMLWEMVRLGRSMSCGPQAMWITWVVCNVMNPTRVAICCNRVFRFYIDFISCLEKTLL